MMVCEDNSGKTIQTAAISDSGCAEKPSGITQAESIALGENIPDCLSTEVNDGCHNN